MYSFHHMTFRMILHSTLQNIWVITSFKWAMKHPTGTIYSYHILHAHFMLTPSIHCRTQNRHVVTLRRWFSNSLTITREGFSYNTSPLVLYHVIKELSSFHIGFIKLSTIQNHILRTLTLTEHYPSHIQSPQSTQINKHTFK